jgi:hypothetical protein
MANTFVGVQYRLGPKISCLDLIDKVGEQRPASLS